MLCGWLLDHCATWQRERLMNVVSPLITDEGEILSKFTCDGQNINPPLQFVAIPHGTKTLVLIVDDPDAPNGTFVHWVLYNIDPSTTFIDENSKPKLCMEGINGFGKLGYGGPCPVSGQHRYFFKLYALKEYLAVPPNPTKKVIEDAMEGLVLEQASLMGTYKRG